jgi:hypothetical protein
LGKTVWQATPKPVALTITDFVVKYTSMSIEREEIEGLISSGVSFDELYKGIEIDEPGILGLTKWVVVKTPKEKRNLLSVRTRLLIQENRDGNKHLSGRNILQEIGGGPLKKGEWLQINKLADNTELLITGTRGVFTIDGYLPPNEPFRWGDELVAPETKPQLEDDGHSFTSIAKLLEDQKIIEIKRLEGYLKKKAIDPE